MIAQIQAELIKIRSTRTTIGLVLGGIALVLIVVLSGLGIKAPDLMSVAEQRNLLRGGGVVWLFSALAGIMLMTSEYRYGTIRPTLLFTPQRSRVLAAKLVAGLLTGVVFGVVGEALAFGVGYAIITGRGIPFALDGGDVTLLLLGMFAGSALWGAIGVGLGAIVRNQVGAIIGLLVWGLVVEKLLSSYVPSIGRFAAFGAAAALAGATTEHLLSAAGGGATLIVWTAALAIAGAMLAARRDVT